MTKKLVLLVALVAVLGAIFLSATGQIGILRWGLVAAACLLLPGLGWAQRSQLRDAGDRLALAIGISISAVTVIGTIMAVMGLWSASAGLIALLAVAVAGFLTKSVLNAIHTGLKWFINLFVGPESPATQERLADQWRSLEKSTSISAAEPQAPSRVEQIRSHPIE